MTEDEAKREASKLHHRIVAVLSESDLQRVAEFLQETWAAGYQAGVRPEPYTITDVGVEGKRAWVIT